MVGTKTAANNATGAAGKASSQVQVIFNGKILTPQSLVQRKAHQSDGHGKRNKVDRGFVEKNETIDEDGVEEADKPVLPTNRNKRSVSTYFHAFCVHPIIHEFSFSDWNLLLELLAVTVSLFPLTIPSLVVVLLRLRWPSTTSKRTSWRST